MALAQINKLSTREWLKGGEPAIWLNASAVTISSIAVIALLILLAVRGFGNFWPADVMQAVYSVPGQNPKPILGEVVETESIPVEQIRASGIPVESDKSFLQRSLLKIGNRDVSGADFAWLLRDYLHGIGYPVNAMVLERREWGNFYGFLNTVLENGTVVADASVDDRVAWRELQERLDRALELNARIYQIERRDIGSINYALEQLRLAERRLQISADDYSPQRLVERRAEIEAERARYQSSYQNLLAELVALYQQVNRDSLTAVIADGRQITIPLAKVVAAYRPNEMGLINKIGFYFHKLAEFFTDPPREANTEGGIFPAIFGTVAMVLIMSVIVTPFGVVAAIYLREYAKQGWLTQTVRVAVNNLAGVPSIVYGVFGLGFFVYFLGGSIDSLFYPEAAPAPVFGTPGLMWASITLALLTLPVVIVATEEGLARIPRSLREGSLALGATKAETLWRVVVPMASPAMMTGLILAVARAAGEVAPLMLVGVVKLAPTLPIDGNFPFVHLERKFMHLGFHIYDVGFQSPNVEAARPLVYATALVLVLVIAVLNFSAVALRNRLREKYKSLDM
jgi:phosphate transport system permease protein